MKLEGIHHVTAITADAPGNVDFYTRVLGLRLVKKTVNQDDPTVYHLFYADELGSPGADLTFFEYPGLPRGRAGAGMVHTVAWRVASEEALDFWAERLAAEEIEVERQGNRLRFVDPEGMGLEIAAVETGDEPLVARHPEIPTELALQGFDGVRAYASDPEVSRGVLEETLGFETDGERAWEARGESRGSFYAYDEPPAERGQAGAGTVHHVAWASSMEEHEAWRERVAEAGLRPTPVIDRFYFRSVYFREPSGVLFELATMGPGFTADEPLETLGEGLSLPPAYEPLRERLEAVLTPLPDPRATRGELELGSAQVPDAPGRGIVGAMALLRRVRVRAFRSAANVELLLGPVAAFVGEARSGKSNLLRAMRSLLDPAVTLDPEDVRRGDVDTIAVEAELDDGRRIYLEARPPETARADRSGAPPVLFLPAGLRTGPLLEAGPGAEEAVRCFRAASEEPRGHGSDAARADALVAAVEACLRAEISEAVFLIEEPELFLRPHTQRYLYRQLRGLASAGNQVLYSTHAPAFLNVARLEELMLVGHDPERGTQIVQPEPLEADEAFRVVSEFDAERSELFLARSAILVEGRTEKLVLPSIFAALGHDADRDEVSIVECGGKSNIPVFARICKECRIPYVVVHDRDADPGADPIPAEVALNLLIGEIAGPERTIVLEPDFEAVAGLRGHSNKPERAWNHFSTPGVDVPEPLARAVELALAGAGRTVRESRSASAANPDVAPSTAGEAQSKRRPR